MPASIALVHHANQYLITNGYENREGLAAVVGSRGSGSGLAAVLDLHERFGVPLNLHISGTLLEAIAWHQPQFLKHLRKLLQSGFIELVGSSYGQNIMRFFGPDYNRRQLNEELSLYQIHLGVDPNTVKAFWPPERVWETRRMAPVLRDANLLNNGYRYVILDDRLLLSPRDAESPRAEFDEVGHWNSELFQMHEIESGLGLVAFPIATRMRRSIPPRQDEDWIQVRGQLEGMLVHASEAGERNLLAIYADDMEKVAGIGEWGNEGPARYQSFLEWMRGNPWIQPVKLSEWAASNDTGSKLKIEVGTFAELANEFDAGEGYEKWYLAEDWAPYREYFQWTESRVKQLAAEGAHPSLIALAEKQLLVSNWETGWHTPSTGPHGDPNVNGHASPWARALTSHCRHAASTAEAAHWMNKKDGQAHVACVDIDHDGDQEVILKNNHLFAVLTPRYGGRIVAVFRVSDDRGAMVIGNPCDDWNWMEELNKYMDAPRNHPGAFADVGFEHDTYECSVIEESGEKAIVRLVNTTEASAAQGLTKEFCLGANATELRVRYQLPESLDKLKTEIALSPDYLGLLRNGSAELKPLKERGVRGYSHGTTAVWVKAQSGGPRWLRPYQEKCGHACMVRLGSTSREFEIALGTSDAVAKARRKSKPVLEASTR